MLGLFSGSVSEDKFASDAKFNRDRDSSLKSWYILIFLAGFTAISWEIIWFRVLDIALQSNAYTYAHLLAFVLMGSAIGSMIGAKAVRYIVTKFIDKYDISYF